MNTSESNNQLIQAFVGSLCVFGNGHAS